MEGQTPGKRVMKIRVVKTDGYQASFGDYFMRWFFRLIDIMFSSGIVGVITMVTNKHNKRLGDLAAGTAVITLKSKYNINHTILVNLSQDYIARFPQVIALSDNDMRIIKENYVKAKNTFDQGIIKKLAEKNTPDYRHYIQHSGNYRSTVYRYRYSGLQLLYRYTIISYI